MNAIEPTYEELKARLLQAENIIQAIQNGEIDAMGDAVLLRSQETLQQTETALKEAERRYHQIMKTAQEGIWTTNAQVCITFANQQIADLLGYSLTDIQGCSLLDFVDEADFPQAKKHLENCQKGIRVRSELCLIRQDGSKRWVIVSSSPFEPDETGQFTGTLGMLTDITERKQAELEREKALLALQEERISLARRVEERTIELKTTNRELRRAVRFKDEFLANMSHELRTPLNAILGMSESMQEQVYGNLNEKQSRCLNTVVESGRHLLSLINDILDIAKIEANKLDLLVEPAAVHEICQASLALVKPLLRRKRITLSQQNDSAVTLIQADARRLKQILTNLLSNAIKFTPEGGGIGLEVNGDLDHKAVRFIVWDTGIGIGQEERQHLFQPFVQLDTRLAREYEGTGLGLALVQRLTRLHGGSITLESEVGKGSRFIVALPWQGNISGKEKTQQNEESEKKWDIPTSVQKTGQAPLVLLAEDNKANIETMLDYLLARNYQVILAYDGIEAIEKAEQAHPDVIIMDIHMPHMSGLDAIRHIRTTPELQATPIIAVTALAMPEDRQRCIDAGATDYLSKPVNLKKLIATIEAQRKQ